MAYRQSGGWLLLGIFGFVLLIYLIRKLREWQWGWVTNRYSLKGKLFIITGGNSGIGFETAKSLAERDAKVIIASRNESKSNEAIRRIQLNKPKANLIFLKLDLSSLVSVRKFAEIIKENYSDFDCLINNAGIAIAQKQFTMEGYEAHFGINHLGHFYLVHLLEDLIKEQKKRIVVVCSGLHKYGKIDFNTLGKYTSAPGLVMLGSNQYYNDSKLANFYFARELYKRGFDVQVLCPGLCYTEIFESYEFKWYHFVLFSPVIWLMMKSPAQGAQNLIHCALEDLNTGAKNPRTGYIVMNLKEQKSSNTFDNFVSEKLWEESLTICQKEEKSQ